MSLLGCRTNEQAVVLFNSKQAIPLNKQLTLYLCNYSQLTKSQWFP